MDKIDREQNMEKQSCLLMYYFSRIGKKKKLQCVCAREYAHVCVCEREKISLVILAQILFWFPFIKLKKCCECMHACVCVRVCSQCPL